MPWYLHKVDKLTSKKYAKTISFLCAGNKLFVKYQAEGGVNPKSPSLAGESPESRKMVILRGEV